MKKIIWIIIVIAILGSLAWWGNSRTNISSSDTIKIGGELPLTGALASFGEEFQRGAKIAEDEINQTHQNSVKVTIEDTALDPKKAVDAVTKLVDTDHVDAVFVSAFSEGAATHSITDKNNIPLMVLWDSNPQLEAMGDKVFALGPWTPASGEVTAEFIYKKGFRKAAIFGYVQEWSTAVSEAFKNKFISLGGTITTSEFSNPGATDYRTQLTKIISSNPEVVYMTTEDFLKGVIQLKGLGYKGVIITSDLLDNNQITENPGLFEGVFGSQVADPATPETSHYINLYKKKFGENPKKILYGTWGYDAVQLFYKTHIDFPNLSLVDGLYKIDYMGASGEVKFDVNGTSKTIPRMFVVKNGIITLTD
jgi:branched-chain amino acid transport system substrate-binding protein